jgi:hypothetical protein
MSRQKLIRIILVSVIAIGILSWFGVSLRARNEKVDLLNQGSLANGVVTGKVVRGSGRSTSLRVQYQFMTNGKTFSGESYANNANFNRVMKATA